ncbi:hypothetical protein EN856_24275 [Mesorhizobium sp. M8A.F.Ca.ET.213.01.1.1]|nr:hypothetical protein EN861_24740 [Mesorhizobium sp. M8A.F.Ca.ET.218.01.1.1]TGT16492.1 hypothetical protein EN856_24275 [Mesorhizobium sp. M8A.F.Ca.ET.213.01.1.1]
MQTRWQRNNLRRGGTAPPSVLPDISPTRGEISFDCGSRPLFQRSKKARGANTAISPLVGEMSGRTEGGAKEHDAP